MRKYTPDTLTLPLHFDVRKCKECLQDLPPSSFAKNSLMKDGLGTRCYSCIWKNKTPHNKLNIKIDDAALRYFYINKKMSVQQCAREMKIHSHFIYARVRELKISRPNSGCEHLIGCTPHNFVGRKLMATGYVRVTLQRDHPFYIMGDSKRFTFEHRVVMAEHIGRPLEKWEVVHHINHIKHDNRIENLQLMPCQAYHQGETVGHTHLLKMKAENEKLKARVAELEAALRAGGRWRE